MDTNSLDYSVEDFLKILTKTNEIVIEQYKKSINQKGFHNISQKEFENWFNEPLPLSGIDSLQLLDEVKEKIVDTATGNLGENMYAYVMAGGNQISTIADFIASTINQNVTKWHLAPAMTEVEKRVISWTAEMINYASDAGGTLVSGGSAANLAGLTVARNTFFRKLNLNKTGLFAKQPFKIYCSKETHNSIDKSVALLGIGTDNLMRIATNPDFTINITALENQIKEDIQNGFVPFCIVGNAGTVNTGAIDDLVTLANLATKYKTWFHIDGAYGGLASSLPNLKSKYAGIEKADSVALDFHKWLYQPFEIGCVLVKNWNILRETYFKQADYLDTAFEDKSDRLEFNEHYFQLSRNAKTLKVWMSVKAYGFTKIQEMMQKDIDLTHYLADLISKSDDFELKAVSDLAIACFIFKGNLELIPALESDGRVFITGTKLNGEFVLRACLINHRKQKSSVNYLLDTIRDVGTKIVERQRNAYC
jgi:aromatic-L-amino-acid/L-tryptophan decarboxylase